MATAIKETRPLQGKEAKEFVRRLRENENRRIPQADYDRAKKTYDEVQKRHGAWF